MGSELSGRSGANEKQLADVISIGQSVTSCAVRNSHAVGSSGAIVDSIAEPRGIVRVPVASPGSLLSGCNCATSIDGVGAR